MYENIYIKNLVYTDKYLLRDQNRKIELNQGNYVLL